MCGLLSRLNRLLKCYKAEFSINVRNKNIDERHKRLLHSLFSLQTRRWLVVEVDDLCFLYQNVFFTRTSNPGLPEQHAWNITRGPSNGTTIVVRITCDLSNGTLTSSAESWGWLVRRQHTNWTPPEPQRRSVSTIPSATNLVCNAYDRRFIPAVPAIEQWIKFP